MSLSERLLRGGKAPAAVVDAAGKIVHAEGAAKTTSAQAALRAQAARMDKARGRALGDEEAVEG